jgi:hypothetical protein
MKTRGEAYLAASRPGRLRALATGCLLAGVVFAGLASTALAAGPEMRGEWELVSNIGSKTSKGIALIRTEANASGEFTSSSFILEGVMKGVFSGTLNGAGTEASVRVTTEASGPYPATEFASSAMHVNTSGLDPTISGEGTLTANGYPPQPMTLTATRIRTYKQIEEQEAREKREREEAEQRTNVRGEWSLVLESGPQVMHGTARITQAANTKSEFSSSSALFEGAIPGTFSGTLSLEAGKSSVTLTTQETGSIPPGRFTSTTVTVTSGYEAMSMSGSGTLAVETSPGKEVTAPATFAATRVKSYIELAQAESQEAHEREARERLAQEARERLEREAREAREREAAAQQTTQTPASLTTKAGATMTVSPVQPASRTFAVDGSGSLSLRLNNPNALAVKGRLTLLLAGARTGKFATTRRRHGGKGASVVLGTSSFSISADGHATVTVKLSRAGRALLARHKTLSAAAKIVTQASGGASVSRTYKLTLRAVSRSPHHH